MIIIEILQRIFGKKKKPIAPIKPGVVFTLPNKPFEQEQPLEKDPKTGEVIRLGTNEQIDYALIDFNKNIVLLSNQIKAYKNLDDLILKYATDDFYKKAPQWQIDEHETDILNKKNAQNSDTKNYARLTVAAYKEESDYNVKLQMFDSYNRIRALFIGDKTPKTYNVLSNEIYNIEAPIAPVNGTGGGRPVVVITNPQTGGTTTVGGTLPTPTTPTTPTNNTQYNTWSDYSTNTVFYPNEIVWANGSLYKALTVIDRSVQPLPTDGRWLKL
jgi:hypothetical protein